MVMGKTEQIIGGESLKRIIHDLETLLPKLKKIDESLEDQLRQSWEDRNALGKILGESSISPFDSAVLSFIKRKSEVSRKDLLQRFSSKANALSLDKTIKTLASFDLILINEIPGKRKPTTVYFAT
jgi:hypothetical protein